MRLPLLLLPLIAVVAVTAQDAAAKRKPAEPSAAELIAARQAMMHMAATLLFESVMPAVKNGTDVKRQSHAADGLALFGRSIAGLFPEGSTGPDSHALPAIWANKADFKAKAAAFGDAAARLNELATAGDTAGFAAQAPVLAKACGGCHTPYRAEIGHH